MLQQSLQSIGHEHLEVSAAVAVAAADAEYRSVSTVPQYLSVSTVPRPDRPRTPDHGYPDPHPHLAAASRSFANLAACYPLPSRQPAASVAWFP